MNVTRELVLSRMYLAAGVVMPWALAQVSAHDGIPTLRSPHDGVPRCGLPIPRCTCFR